MLIIVLVFWIVTIVFSIKLSFTLITKLILLPVLKGFIMGFVASVLFLLIFFFLTSSTNYEAISVNFNNDNSISTWNAYTGRVGLSMFFVGYYLLNVGIDQSFKVLSME